MQRDQHHQGDVGDLQRGLGEVRSLPSQTVRGSSCVCASFLWTPKFCRRRHLVDASILSKPTFCQREYFVATNILLTRVFCHHKYFVLATPIKSVNANIFVSANICHCQCFVSANILSLPTFLIVLV
jgi:hypothetical protein